MTLFKMGMHSVLVCYTIKMLFLQMKWIKFYIIDKAYLKVFAGR